MALPDQLKERQVTLVGVDRRLDLAVLRLEGEGSFPSLPLGDSDELMRKMARNMRKMGC